MGCLDENFIAQYFDLELTPAETDRLFTHIDTCAACAQLFTATVLAHKQARKSTAINPSGATLRSGTARSGGDRGKPLDLEPRVAVGKYQIERILGVGGMGVVYLGWDRELDRKVAIKLLRPDTRISATTLRARLTREAQAMARLSHPNVINVFEIGTYGEQVFVVMELIDGMTLGEWLREQPRSWREIIQVFLAAGAGLEAAHQAGVVHRDFKPDNVLISHDGRVCVTDFGLARIEKDREEAEARPADDPSPPSLALTYSGHLVGTPAYMAPEQMRGEATDARSDLFSFCVALYEALYGVQPYGGSTLAELRATTEAGQLETPRRMLGPRLHRRAIERGLRPIPDDRPPTLRALLDVLRVDPALRRRRLLVGGAAVLALLVGAGALVQMRRHTRACLGSETRLAGIWDGARKAAIHRAFTATRVPYAETMWNTVEKTLDRLSQDWVQMRTEACEATRIAGTQSEAMLDRRMRCLDDRLAELRAQSDLFADADRPLVESGANTARSLGGLERCADLTSLQQLADPPRAAQKADVERLRREAAEIEALDNAGRVAETVKRVPLILADAHRIGYAEIEARLTYVQALTHMRSGHFDDAVGALHDTIANALSARADYLLVKSWQMLTLLVGLAQGKPAEAMVWAKYARAAAVRIPVEAGDLAFFESAYAQLLGDQGRTEESMASARHALQLASAKGSDELYAAITRGNVGIIMAHNGHSDEALAIARDMVGTFDRLLGREHPDSMRARTNLAGALIDQELWAEALPVAQTAVADFTKLDPMHPSTAFALNNLGQAEQGLGRLAEARQHLSRALEIEEKAGIAGSEIVEVLTHLAQVDHALGDGTALTTAERAVAAGDKSKLGPRLMAGARFTLAQLLPATAHARAAALATQARNAYADAVKEGDVKASRRQAAVAEWLAAAGPP